MTAVEPSIIPDLDALRRGEDPCDRFRRDLQELIDRADEDAQSSLLRGVFDLVGLGFVYDLVRGDDAAKVILVGVIDLLVAGAIFQAFKLLGRLAERLGFKKSLAKFFKRFAGPIALALLAIDIGLLVYGYVHRYDDIEEFLPELEAESDCPPEDRRRIIRELGLGD